MRRLISAEFQKLYTTRLWLWLLLISMVLTVLYVYLSIQFADNPDNPAPPLTSPAGQRTALAVVSTPTTMMVAVLAAVGMTGEFRHKTASTTFLATPRRGRVILAKLLIYPIVGLGYALVCMALALAIALPWLTAKNVDVSITDHGIPAALAGVFIAVAIFGVIGVAVGALLRDQVAAVVALLVYLLVAEPLLARIPLVEDCAAYLPGTSERALSQVHQSNIDLLEPWQGGVVLAAYGIALALAAAFFMVRRDVT